MPYFVDIAVSCPQSFFIFSVLTECVVLAVFYHVGVNPIWTTITQTPPFTPYSSIQGLSHLSLKVEDVREASDYYKRVLGFQSTGDARLGLEEFISYLGFGQEDWKPAVEDYRTMLHPSGLTLELTRHKGQDMNMECDATIEKSRGLDSMLGVGLRINDCHQALLYLRNMDSKDCQILQTFPIDLEDEKDSLDGLDDLTAKDNDHVAEGVANKNISRYRSILWQDRYGIKWEFRE